MDPSPFARLAIVSSDSRRFPSPCEATQPKNETRPLGQYLRSGGAAASVIPGLARSLELVDVAQELRPGQPTTAADVHRTECANLDERVEGRAADAQQVGGLRRRHEEGVVHQEVVRRQRVGHVLLLVSWA